MASMPEFQLAGRYPGQVVASQGLHGRQIVIMLVVMAVAFVILWLPVLGDRFYNVLSVKGPRVAVPTFFIGLVVLGLGFLAHSQWLEIAGGCMSGVVVLALILDNY